MSDSRRLLINDLMLNIREGVRRVFLVAMLLLSASSSGWAVTSLERAEGVGSLIVNNGFLYFSDSSSRPVKRIDLSNGRVTPLVQNGGTPAAFAVSDQGIYWVGTRSGQSPSGSCTGSDVIGVLNRTELDGSWTDTITTGDNCRFSASTPPVVDGDTLYWVTSSVSPDSYRIEAFSTVTANSTVLYRSRWQPILAMAKDSAWLYWQEGAYPDGEVIKKMPLGGGQVSIVYQSQLPFSGGLALFGNELFFATRGFPNSRQLRKIALADGTVTTLYQKEETDPSLAQNWIRGMKSDGVSLFWRDNDSINMIGVGGDEYRPLVGALDNSPLALLVNDNRVLWAESTGAAHGETGSIKVVEIDSGKVRILAQTTAKPVALAVAGDTLYWLEGGPIAALEHNGRIASMPLAGGLVRSLFTGVASSPLLSADNDSIYLADGFLLKKTNAAGGGVETLAAADDVVKGLAVGDQNLFWSEGGLSRVSKVPTSGSHAATLLTSGSGPAGPVRYSNGFVYWLDSYNTIKRTAVGGGAIETLAENLPLLSDFVVSGSALFWAEHDTGALKKLSLESGVISPLTTLSPFSAPYSLAVDSNFVYWLDQDQVGKISRAGGQPIVIAADVDMNPYRQGKIAANSAGVYWLETGSGLIQTTVAFSGEATGYLPLTPGQTWTYQDGHGGEKFHMVQRGTEMVNGVQTTVVVDANGYRQYFTNDSNGILLHKEYYPAGLISTEAASWTFLSPLVYAEKNMQMGQQVASRGRVAIDFSSFGKYVCNFEAVSVPEGFETLDLAAGQFKTVRLRTDLRVYGTINGQPFDSRSTLKIWLAQDIGLVQWRESENGSDETWTLSALDIDLANLAVYHAPPPARSRLGQAMTLGLLVRNQGPAVATGVKVVATLPAAFDFQSASGGCDHLGGVVTCTLVDLAPAASQALTIAVIPRQTGNSINTVQVKGDQADPNPDNNTITAGIMVVADQDGDNLVDSLEKTTCTDSLLADTDGDQLLDGVEDANQNGRQDAGETDPCNRDSDGDLMPDGWESSNGTNPLVRDGDNDDDRDGFTNYQEFLAISDPQNPLSTPKGDIDGDGMVTLEDAILVLQTLSRYAPLTTVRPDYVHSATDANGDGRIGPEDLSYILNRLAIPR